MTFLSRLYDFACGALIGAGIMGTVLLLRHEGRQQQFRATLESNYNARLDDLSKRFSDLKLVERRGK